MLPCRSVLILRQDLRRRQRVQDGQQLRFQPSVQHHVRADRARPRWPGMDTGWTLDGRLPADLLDPRPWQVPDLLLEAEDYSTEARAYRDAAHQRALWAAWALGLQGRPMDLAQLRRLLDREELLRALAPFRGRDSRNADWLTRLEHQRG